MTPETPDQERASAVPTTDSNTEPSADPTWVPTDALPSADVASPAPAPEVSRQISVLRRTPDPQALRAVRGQILDRLAAFGLDPAEWTPKVAELSPEGGGLRLTLRAGAGEWSALLTRAQAFELRLAVLRGNGSVALGSAELDLIAPGATHALPRLYLRGTGLTGPQPAEAPVKRADGQPVPDDELSHGMVPLLPEDVRALLGALETFTG